MVTDTVKSVMGICDGWGIYQTNLYLKTILLRV